MSDNRLKSETNLPDQTLIERLDSRRKSEIENLPPLWRRLAPHIGLLAYWPLHQKSQNDVIPFPFPKPASQK